MVFKRFFLLFLLVFFLLLWIFYSLCLAQYTTYNPTLAYQTNPLNYINYQTSAYFPYQTSSYWPLANSYFDPYNQTVPYGTGAVNYSSGLSNPLYPITSGGSFNPALNPVNSIYNYNSLGSGYPSVLFNPYGTYGFPLNLSSIYYPGIFNINNTATGTTTTNGNTDTTGNTYNAQATAYLSAIYQGISPALQINPNALSAFPISSGLYLNPLTNYIPNQSYYQNPYASYPYNFGSSQFNTINPYQLPIGYSINPYSTSFPINYQTDPLNQPLPYYQPNYTTSPSQSNISNINGTWTGTWFTTQANGTVNNGDANLTLTQNGSNIYGNVSLSQNSYLKLNANINGTITGASLTLTGSLINGTEFYTLTINGNISGTNLSGTYSISTNSGSIIESGTYSIAKL